MQEDAGQNRHQDVLVAPTKVLPSSSLFLDFCTQLSLALFFMILGVVGSYLQHGFLIGGRHGVPLAGSHVYVPIRRLLVLGLGAGYITALMGQATGIISLPYAISVLKFQSLHITPTVQVETLINPIGALIGYYRQGQRNWDLAMWPSLGAIFGSNLGPLVRTFWLADNQHFESVLGIVFIFLGTFLCSGVIPFARAGKSRLEVLRGKFDAHARAQRTSGRLPSGLPEGITITTVERGWGHIVVEFWGEQWKLSVLTMFGVGFATALVASTLGVGGGAILVPLMTQLYQLPMHLLVAASIPFVITQSAVSLLSYGLVVPHLTGHYASPEWAWGLFVGSAGIVGSWCGAHSQRYLPERILKPTLGLIMTGLGIAYIIR